MTDRRYRRDDLTPFDDAAVLATLERLAVAHPDYPHFYRHEIATALVAAGHLHNDEVGQTWGLSASLQRLRTRGLADCSGSGGAWSPTPHTRHLRA